MLLARSLGTLPWKIIVKSVYGLDLQTSIVDGYNHYTNGLFGLKNIDIADISDILG